MTVASSDQTVVGITGLDAGPNPHPGVAVALALKADPSFKGGIVGLPYDPMLNGALVDDLFDAYSLFPWPGDPDGTYIAAARRAQRDHGLNVLLPCLDSDVPTLSRLRDELANMGIACLVPPLDSIKKRLKWNLPELGRRLGFDVPKTIVVYDTEQLHPVDGWSFPLYIKGSLADAEPAENQEEAAFLFKRMARRWGYPVMAQEARSGVEYLLAGVCRENSEPSALLSIRKVRTTGLGKATAAVTVHDPELEALGRRILEDLSWRGPFELEFLKDTANGRLYLIEINARFPAWISFSQSLGFDVAGDLVRIARGEDTPFREAPPAGTHFTRAFRRDVGHISNRRIIDALSASTKEPLVQ